MPQTSITFKFGKINEATKPSLYFKNIRQKNSDEKFNSIIPIFHTKPLKVSLIIALHERYFRNKLGARNSISIICDALRNLVPFVQFKKREKNPWRSACSFSACN